MMVRIMGTGTGFGVVLHPENRLMTMFEGCHRAVFEVEMGDLDQIGRQRLGSECKSVVLTGDLHLTGGPAGMVEAPMAIAELEGASPEGQAQNLVPQTDAEPADPDGPGGCGPGQRHG